MYTINTEKMKQIMAKRHWCVADVAVLSGLSYPTVRDIVKGEKQKYIRLDTVARLANVFETTIQDFTIEV
ncbi:MAG: helix-turn-helix transcriptional regulator [Lachnospiraceae bacterium]|nr:helix-turn-helix transcriptional regulator [Lachnospiraceae bacterium]MDD7390947.1 helix-turn-helix transcriptional regulator [Lachnospiraceae bacterium]